MTNQTPIERGAEAVYKTGPGYDLTGEKHWKELSTSSQDNARRNARAVFNSIDTNQLARILHPGYGKPRYDQPEDEPCAACLKAHETAQAIKNWLTGKEPAMTTKFEQARVRPKPPRINEWDHETYQDQHGVWAIIKATNGAWLTFEPRTTRFAEHPTWEQAIQWVGKQVRRAESLQL